MTADPSVPILMVDDNRSKRLALAAVLAPLGYTIVEADSGRAALRCVMAQDFAVILMDVVMPDMDGFETAGLIRQREQSHMTPIIFITAHGKDEIVRPDLYAEGAVDFIFAPVPAHELRSKVSVFANLFIKAQELAARAREVQTSADRLRLLTDVAPIGIFQTDAQNRYVYTNPRWSEITGVPAGDALGRSWDTIIDPAQRAGLTVQLADGSPDRAELSHRFELHPPGEDALIVLATSRSLPDRSGGTTGWVGTLADVTAEAGAEVAMSDARDQADESSRLKSDFLANMSHEIRTPMNGVIGMAELLLETELDARQLDYALTVRHSGEALLTIIDDILDFSKVEAGQMEIEEIEFDLRHTVEAAMDLLARSARAKGLALVVAIESGIPAVAIGDPGRVRQVLLNLVGNAIKFTPSGEVVVRVSSAAATHGETVLRFEVSDTGNGMTPEKLDQVFQPFIQADSSTSRRYGGTGLGLTISRQLVELMGGWCGASSQVGEGSVFWFTVPVRTEAAQDAPDLDPIDDGLAGVRVLLAEQNESRSRVLARYMTEWGMKVTTADTAEATLSALREAADGAAFEVAVIDCSMSADRPIKDEIDADPSLVAKLVLLFDVGEKWEPKTDLDADTPCLSKPVHLEDLRSCLRLAAGLDEPEPEATAPEGSHAGPATGQLLLAEDNLVNQKVTLAMLSTVGYHVDQVLTGAEAVRAVARRHYDAILMDCQMPEMNGYEATAAIRAREGEGQHTPIIALTAGARSRDRERCLEAGMDDYLAKPVTKDALLSLVARYLRSGAQEARASLDEDTVSALEALDHDAMANVVSLYFDEAAKQMSNLSSAIDRGEPLAISQAAHRLKGSSGTLGAATVLQIATELEESADQGDLTNAESLFARLDVGLEETRDAFCSRMEAGPGS